jgi:hypothetical protein
MVVVVVVVIWDEVQDLAWVGGENDITELLTPKSPPSRMGNFTPGVCSSSYMRLGTWDGGNVYVYVYVYLCLSMSMSIYVCLCLSMSIYVYLCLCLSISI